MQSNYLLVLAISFPILQLSYSSLIRFNFLSSILTYSHTLQLYNHFLHSSMSKNDRVELDVKNNKVKEGMLLKQSRHIKEWKQRWMVLTKTHIYSFQNKGQYRDPTEIVQLKDIQTLKSYYKDQYKKPFTFRIQSQDVNFHMSAKSSEQKWAWMTAIEKMVERVIHPEAKSDTQNLIRQTIKMATAVRQTLQKKQQKQRKQSSEYTDNLIKKIRMKLESLVVEFQYRGESKQKPDERKLSQQLDQNRIRERRNRNNQYIQFSERKIQKSFQKQVLRVKQNTLTEVLNHLIKNSSENPKHIINFAVSILISKSQHYQPQILQFCNEPQSRRFFAQYFLLMLNEEIDENVINAYIKFLIILYENCRQYFYATDLKALISILINDLEMNRSQFNQYLIMLLLQQMAKKDWWNEFNFRKAELKSFVKQLGSISGSENQLLSQQLLKIL